MSSDAWNDVERQYQAEADQLRAKIQQLRAVLKPFAEYADKTHTFPPDTVITMGSPMSKRQLTMGDCYGALHVLEGAA
jgi:hypothetical protein